VVVVAEAPNWDDTYNPAKRRLTYDIETDATGNFTRELLRSVGLRASEVFFTNCVLCLPARQEKKYPVRSAQKRNCLTWLSMAINACDAKVVVTLGEKALEATGMLSRHGLVLQLSAGRLHVWNKRYLLPLYHPGRLGRVTRKTDQQFADIQPLKQLVSADTM